MKLLLILLPFICSGQWYKNPELSDAAHWYGSCIGVVVLTEGLTYITDEPELSTIISGVSIFGLGMAKEFIWDGKMNRGVKSQYDMILDGAGSLAGMMVITVKFNIYPPVKKKTSKKLQPTDL